MQELMIRLMNEYGYLGIGLLIWIENIFPPIPSEVILIFGGYMTTRTNLGVAGVIIFATIGSGLGAILLYGLGRILKKERLKLFFASKVGCLLGLKPEYVDKADLWFEKYEYKAVLICRCIPIVRSFISVPAGISKMNIVPFMGLTLLGSAIWNTVLVIIGAFAGEQWETWVGYIGVYSKAALVLFGIIGIVGIILFVKARNKKR